ncbi:hypothetical protein AK812_SmicGene49091 [Symbiodinium microadriaticum]|uniref:Uncharacterized protein n=1 Tax=Symbiodinium microadriaticum TaxID=2951 RepID=A0A1Q9CPB0_SYMMI|nr:hypothetical protein AK812_SmicGene49091 [Symbiodinium microadriaticum]
MQEIQPSSGSTILARTPRSSETSTRCLAEITPSCGDFSDTLSRTIAGSVVQAQPGRMTSSPSGNSLISKRSPAFRSITYMEPAEQAANRSATQAIRRVDCASFLVCRIE